MKDMKFNQIDIEKWNRKEYYIHYMNELCCTYSLTVNIDITNLKTVVKKMNKKIYNGNIINKKQRKREVHLTLI